MQRLENIVKREQVKGLDYLDRVIKDIYLKKIKDAVYSGAIDIEELKDKDNYMLVKIVFNIIGEKQFPLSDEARKIKNNLRLFI